jgi:acyl-CoA thioester hydrolase
MKKSTPRDPASHDGLLADFPLRIEIPVLWGDEDSFAHVNNLVYLRWCETARVEYFRRIGLFPEMPPRGLGPILASMTCHYRRPLKYPDTITVGTRVTRIGNTSLRMEHLILSHSVGDVAAEADSTIVTVDYATGKPHRVPDAVREAIAELENAPRHRRKER